LNVLHIPKLSFLFSQLFLLLKLQKNLKVVDVIRRSGNKCQFFSWLFLRLGEKLLCLLGRLLPDLIELLLKVLNRAGLGNEATVHIKGVCVLKMSVKVCHLLLSRLLLLKHTWSKLAGSWLPE